MTAARGFAEAEFAARVDRAQTAMAAAGLDALFLTTEAELRYYAGFLTRFWESPTRPWFMVVPRAGAPVAVIPEIGAALMGATWVRDIRTWPAPDPVDDGVTLLAEALCELVPDGGRIGLAMGPETLVRMPMGDFDRLRGMLGGRRIVDDGAITRDLRMVKSEAEVAKIARAVAVADRAFARVGEVARAGVALSEVFRRFQMLCLEEGADHVPYIAGAAGRGGYSDVISPATDAPLVTGDVLMLDTGLLCDGYFCDFNRNFSVGPPAPDVVEAHAVLVRATAAGMAALRPGVSMGDIWSAMDGAAREAGFATPAGRLGHGLGLQLTEWPSIRAGETVEAVAGMVLTLEPSVVLGDGRMMVHEENIVVTEGGARMLSAAWPEAMPVLS